MPADATVVIIHGLWMTGVESTLLQRHLRAQTGWATTRFSYASVRDPLQKIVADLAEFIGAQGQGPVHLVAHSLGGLVVHELAHSLGLPRAGRIVLLCSPIQGSSVAARLARWSLLNPLLGKAVGEALVEPVLRSWEAQADVGVLAGDRSLGLGRILGGFDGPNDGTVSVKETKLPGATDSIILPVSHSSALFSAGVAAQTAFFLSHGRFRHVAGSH